MEKTYFTINNEGTIGVHDVSKERAEQDLEYNQKNYPDEDWQMFEDD
jgi:hypothetical protein